jgi:hypothetical protein
VIDDTLHHTTATATGTHLGIEMFDLGILPPAQLLHRHQAGPVDFLGTGRFSGVHEAFAIGEFFGSAVFPEVGDRL